LSGRVVLATSLLLALLAFATPALADTDFTVEEQVPLAGTFTNDCRAEQFVVTGFLHTKNHVTVGLDGSIHMYTGFNFQDVHGTAASGARYVMTAESNRSWNSAADGAPQEGNYVANLLMNRLGEDGLPVLGDDLYQKILAHYTVNGNGVTKVDRYEVTFDCR
jgi:hypothetical protein